MALNDAFIRIESFKDVFDQLWQETNGQPYEQRALNPNELSTIDLSTPDGQKRLYDMILSGADGMVITPNDSKKQKQEEEKKKEMVRVWFETLMIDAQRREIEEEITRLTKENNKLEQDNIELREEETILRATIVKLETAIDENTVQMADVRKHLRAAEDKVQNTRRALLSNIDGADAPIEAMESGAKDLITICAYLPGQSPDKDALQRLVIYTNPEGTYYVLGKANAKGERAHIPIEELIAPPQGDERRFSFAEDIAFQKSQHKKFGETLPTAAQTYGQAADKIADLIGHDQVKTGLYNALQLASEEVHALKIAEAKLDLERKNILEQLNKAKSELQENLETQSRNQAQIDKNNARIEELQNSLKQIDGRFDTLSKKSAQAEQAITDVRNYPQRYQDYKNGLISRDEMKGSIPPYIEQQLFTLYEDASQARAEANARKEWQDSILNKLEQSKTIDHNGIIREKYRSSMGPASEFFARYPRALSGVTSVMAKTMVFFGVDNDLIRDWKEKIITHEGEMVYRENGDARKFYTLGINGEKQYINDLDDLAPILEKYLNKDDVWFTANETPHGLSKHDKFEATLKTSSELSKTMGIVTAYTEAAEQTAEKKEQKAEEALRTFSQDNSSQTSPDRSTSAESSKDAFAQVSPLPALAPKVTVTDQNAWTVREAMNPFAKASALLETAAPAIEKGLDITPYPSNAVKN